ncbi:hypothetical protein QEN19_001166 [Hanseniaspora menglaensis]
MVVLSAFVATKSGKSIVSRQFRDLEKNRSIELLNQFQSEVTKNKSRGNFIEVEEDHIRYVYKPIDDFYMVLITNLQSNIIQDIKTLNLFAETVNSLLSLLLYKSPNEHVPLKSSDEELISLHAFDLINAFDEIITLGYKENVKTSQILNSYNMWSMEETWKNINDESKERAAKENRKRELENIDRRRRSGGYQNFNIGHGQSADPNVLQEAYNSYYSHASDSARESFMHSQEQKYEEQKKAPHYAYEQEQQKHIYQEETDGTKIDTEPYVEDPENKTGLMFIVKETISTQLSRDGDISSSELKGTLELRIADESMTTVGMKLNIANPKDKKFNFKTHPNIDKASFLNEGVLKLRDTKKSFPSNDQALGILRWRQVGTADDDHLVPLRLVTWVNQLEENKFEVTFEYELNEKYKSLKECFFILPLNEYGAGEITDLGDFNEGELSVAGYDPSQGLVLYANEINQSQGVFTVTVDNIESEESLFPINVSFVNLSDDVSTSLSNVSVTEVVAEGGEPIANYGSYTVVKSDNYNVV